MGSRRIASAVGLAVAVAIAAGVVAAVAIGSRGRPPRLVALPAPTETRIDCHAPALGGRLPAVVYLPHGYAAHGPALPVVYFLHGLPAGPQTYTQYKFVAGAIARDGRRAIVVGPQGARTSDSDQEYLDWSRDDDWPTAIDEQLVSCVDHRYDVIRARRGRALVGLSAGGYGALDIGLRALSTFAAVESWSGYFRATDPSGHHVLKLPTAAATRAATVPTGAPLAAELRRRPSLIGFYVGRSDARFAADNAAYDRTLTAERIPHLYRTYPGGHSESLWQRQAPGWLDLALAYLQSGRVVSP